MPPGSLGNVLGIADLVSAVTLGVLTVPGPLDHPNLLVGVQRLRGHRHSRRAFGPRLRRLTALTGYAVQPLFATMRSMERRGRRSNFKPLVFGHFRPAVDRYFKRPHTQRYGKAVACLSESCPKNLDYTEGPCLSIGSTGAIGRHKNIPNRALRGTACASLC